MSFYDERAALYDIAFSWDIAAEVDWLLARLGSGVKTILEPACGSGRMFPAFSERGVEVVGVELSERMISRARQRMAAVGLAAPRILHADMTDFDMDERFDGAISPINSFGYLLSDKAASTHLQCVARHLRSGGKYLVQMDLLDYDNPPLLTPEGNSWEMQRQGLKVRTAWFGRSFDLESRLETQICRFEVLSGLGAGTVTEDEHILRRWNWAEWTRLIDESPFALVGCYDGNSDERDALPLDQSLQNRWLIWHELVRS
ncbi:MAG: SAM-dependent methyltransferase [Planctomycetota bacterium]|jgi:SAM-dependent methyltransferase